MLGFFSFTEVTDPSAHEAYNAWHQLDHLPEQFTVEGITFGQRWVRSPRCREEEAATSPLLEPFHYMTLYLLRDREVLPAFAALGERMRVEGRFFEARRALLSGPFEVVGQWAAPRVLVSPGVVPHRPSQGVYVVVGPRIDGAALTLVDGVAGAWAFADADAGRHVTVVFVDGELFDASVALAAGIERLGESPEWAGPLEQVEPNRWGWFDTLHAR